MIKKTITFIDFDDEERTEDFYFNLTKAELIEMAVSEDGGLEKVIKKLIQEKDNQKIIEIFKDLLFRSYGEKTLDGRKFVKSKELSIAFSQTQAYSDLFMELAENPDKASEFVNGIMPKSLESAAALGFMPAV